MQATHNTLSGRFRAAAVLLALAMGLAGALGWGSVPRAATGDWRTQPAVLVLVHDPGCPYCARWEAEVERSYTLSQEGKFAPLVKRLRTDPDIADLKKIVYSPTFVMFAYGHEVGRIVGYQGSDLFWMQLQPLVEKAGFAPSAGAAVR